MLYRRALTGLVLSIAASGAACAGAAKPGATTLASAKIAPRVEAAAAVVEPAAAPPLPLETELEPVEYGEWKGFGVAKCSYLAPKRDFVSPDGGVDVVFHFHAGQMSDRQMRESGLSGVFVSCGFGLGGGPYARAFSHPSRFGRMVSQLMGAVGRDARQRVHLRHLTLASWSAGFAAVSRILSVPEWYEATDTVLLFDSLHAAYKAGSKPNTASQGEEAVDTRSLGVFIRFARDAAEGKKTMVITHSSIIPPDYASSSEATGAVLDAIEVEREPVDEPFDRGMRLSRRADAAGLHVRGFRGRGPTDHFDHLRLIGTVVRSWVAPRYKADDPVVYTAAGEQR